MGNLLKIGCIFFGLSVAEIGLQAIYYTKIPYILTLPPHFNGPALVVSAVVFGIIFVVAGIGILFKKRTREISLLFGIFLLLIFCFYYIPYEFLTSSNYMHLEDWENAEKELAFAGGALVIAGCFSAKKENRVIAALGKLIPAGPVIFAITIISFGILHFMLVKEAAPLVPAWIPYHLFWIYFCGAALLGSGIAIILKIKVGIIAALLGLMIFIWFVCLHIPRIIASPAIYLGSEITSAFLALAYSGIAFVIAGAAKKPKASA
jgi:uncharacterized membrane protein YphA (DoxX/SURF4 family)